MRFWSGDEIKELKDNQIFVFGSNPSGIHGAGAAKAAVEFGAKYGVGRGLQGQTYALITKNLKAGFHEKATGITYETDGYKSVTAEQIKTNVQELYQCAKQHPDKFFIVAYKNETWPNGKPKKSLNGYTSEEMFSIFMNDNNIPDNIILHNSFKPLAKSYLENQQTKQEKNMELNDNHYLYKFTAVYMALLDTNNPTQEQLDLLAEHKFIKEPMQLVKPEAFVLKGNTITERSGFLYHLSKQVTKSLTSKLVDFNSPYQIDKKLGLEFETGLTQKWPMNATVALTKITEDEHHVGYMAISSHENTAAIIKDKATGKAEIHLHTRTRNPDLTLFAVTPSGITMYKHNDTIEELEGMINDEHTFQLTEMMYVGLTKLTTAFDHQPAHVEPEEPEADPEPEEVKAKRKNKLKR